VKGRRGVPLRGVPLTFSRFGRGVERPWRRSHGANLNPATAVSPAVEVSAKPWHVSAHFTATTAAMEATIVCCACGCDIPANHPQDAVRERRHLSSGNPSRAGDSLPEVEAGKIRTQPPSRASATLRGESPLSLPRPDVFLPFVFGLRERTPGSR
jgi:hypothetical protein